MLVKADSIALLLIYFSMTNTESCCYCYLCNEVDFFPVKVRWKDTFCGEITKKRWNFLIYWSATTKKCVLSIYVNRRFCKTGLHLQEHQFRIIDLRTCFTNLFESALSSNLTYFLNASYLQPRRFVLSFINYWSLQRKTNKKLSIEDFSSKKICITFSSPTKTKNWRVKVRPLMMRGTAGS